MKLKVKTALIILIEELYEFGVNEEA